MNRINQLFNSNKKDILSVYFCAGDPTLDGTANVIRTLEKHGVSMIEIGLPFSDPMADGIVIQNAATRALRNGMSLKLLFEQLRDIRKDVSIPLVFMGYLNPIMQFGFENFCRQCVECGIDGVIIPDLPFRDYQEQYRIIAGHHPHGPEPEGYGLRGGIRNPGGDAILLCQIRGCRRQGAGAGKSLLWQRGGQAGGCIPLCGGLCAPGL